jgi:tRNA1(Val) A37 N6-methylase TrmN6
MSPAAIRVGRIGERFHNNGQPNLKADYVLANPPFNNSD